MKEQLFQREKESKTRPAPLGRKLKNRKLLYPGKALIGEVRGTEKELQRIREEHNNWLVAGRTEWDPKENVCHCPVHPSLKCASAGTGRSCLLECRFREQTLEEMSAVAAKDSLRGWRMRQHKWEHSQKPKSPQTWSTIVRYEKEELGHCSSLFPRASLCLYRFRTVTYRANLHALATAWEAVVAPMGCLHARVGLMLQLSLRGCACRKQGWNRSLQMHEPQVYTSAVRAVNLPPTEHPNERHVLWQLGQSDLSNSGLSGWIHVGAREGQCQLPPQLPQWVQIHTNTIVLGPDFSRSVLVAWWKQCLKIPQPTASIPMIEGGADSQRILCEAKQRVKGDTTENTDTWIFPAEEYSDARLPLGALQY